MPPLYKNFVGCNDSIPSKIKRIKPLRIHPKIWKRINKKATINFFRINRFSFGFIEEKSAFNNYSTPM